MSFQAYLDNIEKKTGKNLDDLKKIASEKGFLVEGKLTVKAIEFRTWSWTCYGNFRCI